MCSFEASPKERQAFPMYTIKYSWRSRKSFYFTAAGDG